MEHILENSFRDIALKETDIELYEFNKAIAILEYIENNNVNEGTISDFLSKVSSNIKKKIDFIKELAEMTKNKLKDLLIMFKDTRVFKFFKVIGFNIKKLGLMIKKGIDAYNSIQDIIAKKIYDMGGVQYIRKNLHELDEFFKSHPVIKKIGGIAVAGLLVYIWLNMSFTPDLEYSMDFKDIILALGGSFSVAELFASPSGISMLIYLATGALAGLSMPWPGGTLTQITGGVLYSLWKLLKIGKIEIQKPEPLKLGKYPKVNLKA